MSPEPQYNANKEFKNEPSHPITGPVSSDDDDVDAISNDPNNLGYQPLPQEYNFEGDDDDDDNESDEESIDYQSVGSLMAALSENGPTEVIETNIVPVPLADDVEDTVHQISTSNKPTENVSLKTTSLISQSEEDRKVRASHETASIWNGTPGHSLDMDKDKEDKIKSMMSGFTLPTSSIPAWARQMSDDELNALVLNKVAT